MSVQGRLGAPGNRMSSRQSWTRLLAEYALPLALILLVIFFAFESDAFLSVANGQNILRQSSVIAIAAMGMALLLINGAIDISQGAVMATTTLLVVELTNAGIPQMTAILAGLGLGLSLGFVNGFFAEVVGIPSLIATLGTALLIRGLGFVVTGGRSTALDREQGEVILWMGRGSIGGIPAAFLITVAVALIAIVALKNTVWGRHSFAIGGSQDAARSAGVRIRTHRFLVFGISGAISSLAGIVLAGQLGSAAPSHVPNAEFDVITAAVLGGVSIFGGRGRMWMVVLAAVFVAVLANGLVQLNISAFWSPVATGAVFLAALALDRFRDRNNA